ASVSSSFSFAGDGDGGGRAAEHLARSYRARSPAARGVPYVHANSFSRARRVSRPGNAPRRVGARPNGRRATDDGESGDSSATTAAPTTTPVSMSLEHLRAGGSHECMASIGEASGAKACFGAP